VANDPPTGDAVGLQLADVRIFKLFFYGCRCAAKRTNFELNEDGFR
jgi:hypothetical protein